MQDVTRQFHFSGAHTSRDRASSQGKRIAPTSKTTVTAVAHKGSLAKSKPLADILPSEKLEYNGNGFYKLMSTGKPPKLIKSDQAMMEMAVSVSKTMHHSVLNASLRAQLECILTIIVLFRPICAVKRFIHNFSGGVERKRPW